MCLPGAGEHFRALQVLYHEHILLEFITGGMGLLGARGAIAGLGRG
jgi:hypothetical protein